MPHNPYSAPSSTVQDPPAAPRPPEATRALQILWVTFVITFVTMLPAIRGEWWVVPDAEEGDGIFVILVTGLFAAVYGVLIWLTGRRRNWARWALLVFIAGTTALAAPDLPRTFAETPAAAIADVCIALAELWAFRLLLFGPGAEWFRDR
jgi:hypothetical protein